MEIEIESESLFEIDPVSGHRVPESLLFAIGAAEWVVICFFAPKTSPQSVAELNHGDAATDGVYGSGE